MGERGSTELPQPSIFVCSHTSPVWPSRFAAFLDGESDPTNEENYDIEIAPEQFAAALDRLVPNVFNVTQKELKGLIDEFDSDGNGTISVVEFREFCYRIPHLAWKVRVSRACRPPAERRARAAASASSALSKLCRGARRLSDFATSASRSPRASRCRRRTTRPRSRLRRRSAATRPRAKSRS